jgi:hypothetical protein
MTLPPLTTNPQRPVAARKSPPTKALPRAPKAPNRDTLNTSSPRQIKRRSQVARNPRKIVALGTASPQASPQDRSPCTWPLHGLDRARLGSLGCTRLWPRAPLAMRRPPSEEVPPQGHG